MDRSGIVWQIGEMGKLDLGGGGTVAKYVANPRTSTPSISACRSWRCIRLLKWSPRRTSTWHTAPSKLSARTQSNSDTYRKRTACVERRPLFPFWYKRKTPNSRKRKFGAFGGDEGDRTPYLLHAMQALSQVSYTPVVLPQSHCPATVVIIAKSPANVNHYFGKVRGSCHRCISPLFLKSTAQERLLRCLS